MADQAYWQGKNVLVTGGAGFLGSHLVERLVGYGAKVTVVDRLTTGSHDNIAHVARNLRFLELDVLQMDWRELLEPGACDVLFHMAGSAYVPLSVDRPGWDFAINLQSTFNLLEAIRALKWEGALVYPSSAAVYGNPSRMPIREDDPTVPISPYGVSKLAAERYLAVYSQLYGIRAAAVRTFSAYGPRQRKLVVYDLMQRLEADPEELFMFGDGSQVRDFIYAEDVVHAMTLVGERGNLNGEVYNVASGRAYSIRELAEKLCAICGRRPRLVLGGKARPGEPEKWTVDIRRIQSLGFSPSIDLHEGLSRTIDWYRRECKLQT